jgi:hypothetical protein
LNLHQALNLTNLLFFAFLINLPLGYYRKAAPRYSLRWFVYIHLSIPFIIAIRLAYGFGHCATPFTLACVVIGQVVGGKINRRRM